MTTPGREGLNGAFEAVKEVCPSGDNDLESLVVVVSANLATGHKNPFVVTKLDLEQSSMAAESALH